MLKYCAFLILMLIFSTTSSLADSGSSDVIELDFGASEEANSVESQVMEVVATGVGIEPEKALQNAFSHAIEQAVGVLVDAETRVKNDEIVSDQVLTFSRGFVQEYTVVKQWKKDNLHYARIRARVAVSKLAEKLKAHKIAVREVPGELLYRQIKHELITEENAAEMFRKAMQDFRMDKLVKVEIEGKPEVVEKDETHAKLRKKGVKVSADMDQWRKFRQNMYPLLLKLASKRTTFSSYRKPLNKGFYQFVVDWNPVTPRLQGPGGQIFLLRQMSRTGNQTTWDAFRVPGSLGPAVADAAEIRFQICIRMLDSNDNTIWQVKKSVRKVTWLPFGLLGPRELDWCNLSPFLWRHGYFGSSRGWGHYAPWFILPDVMVELELDKLRQVAKCAAYLEEVKQ